MRTTLLKFVLLFSLVLLNTSLSTGQIQYNNIRFKQLSIAEGLPHNTINAITQDNHGFIWFGTRNGLCRYDGYNINLFAHNEADSTSLRHNFITRLYNDSLRNILWISTDQGICSYNYETEDFSRYQIKGNTKDDVCFLNTSDGMLLAACSNGLYRYNEQDSLFVPFLLDKEKPHVRYFAEDGDRTLWIDTNKGLMRYSLEKKQFVSLPTLIQPFTLQCNNAYTHYMLWEAQTGDVLTGLVTLLNCSWSYAYVAEKIVERCPDALRDKRYGSWFAGYVSESYRRTNQMLIDRIDALSGFIDEKTAEHLCEIFEKCCLFDLRFWDMVYAMGGN